MNVSDLLTNSSSNFIPIRLVSESTPYQFWLTLLISGAMLLFYFLIMFRSQFSSLLLKYRLRAFTKLTRQPTVVIKHDNEGFFSMSMITTNLIPKLNKILQKLKGRRFNLVLQTPGGDVFATILLSKIFYKYPNKIDVYVPNYAMSGGSLLTLTGDRLHFNDYSCIGPIDPQIGGIFSGGSAAGWKDVMRIKKNKANDQSIIYHRLGKQVETSIYNYIYGLVKNKCKKPKEFTKFISDGNIEHIFQLDMDMLKKYGFDVQEINPLEKELLDGVMKIKTQEEIFSSV